MWPLRTLADADRHDVGGKALELARLSAAGVPVPAGCVVPASVFQRALREAGLWARAEAVAGGGVDPALADAIRALPLPEPLVEGWISASRTLGPRLAVRSSGVDEDGPARSFAGQHDTLLGVAPEQVPDAIRACWASLVSPRALAYRAGQGPAPGALAVLVMPLLEPACAGVMFTINPMNGSWREMVVEAVWGLGEGLVSGQLTPHGYLVRRPRRAPRWVTKLTERVRLSVMQRDLPALPERWVRRADGTVGPEATPVRLRDRPTLDDATLRRLCRVGLRVERALGAPQDVEWCRDEAGRLWVLQARPITATGTPRPREDVIWTRRFIGERWPEPATPLGWSLLEPVLRWFIDYPETQAAHLGGAPPLMRFEGYAYVNATVFRHLAFKLPGAPAPRFMLELVPPEEEAAWRRRFAVAPHLAVYASILRTTIAERRWRRFAFNPLTNPEAWEAYRARLETALPALSAPVADPIAGLERVEAQLDWIRDYIGVHVCSLLFANLAYQLLDGALASFTPDRRREAMGTLATCPPGNLTVETNQALASLAAAATPRDLERLAEGRAEGLFADRLAAFLARYGHRSEASWEIMAPRWRDAPERLVPLLRHPPTRVAARHDDRAVDALLDDLGGALSATQQATLRALTRHTRRYLLLRENQRFWFDHLLAATRDTLTQLGAWLVEQGALHQAADVAYLEWPTARAALRDGPPPGLADRATEAREAWLRDAERSPPVFLRDADPRVAQATSGRLTGLAISAGKHRGRVRVLRRLADADRLEQGEVLVARAVDPAWTPLFARAGAVALEMGSLLSHGAVVAREYGVPAVVNLDGLTERVRDGDEVTVDGDRGVLWLHDGGAR